MPTSSPIVQKGISLASPTAVYAKASTSAKVLKQYAQGTVLKYKPLSIGRNEVTVYLNGTVTILKLNMKMPGHPTKF